jgi:Zn-dependent M28 family amino/carboxypeptidase
MTKRTAAALALFLCLVTATGLGAQTADRILTDVTRVAGAASNPERRAALTAILEAEGVQYQLEDFVDRRMRMGTNIIVTLPGSSDATIVVGGHYDRVGVGQGALDNGASCAVLLELLRAMKARPLKKHTLRVVFFDLEEGGLSGSQAHFMGTGAQPGPQYGINLDIFAYGDALFAAASLADGTLAGALTEAATELSIPLQLYSPAQYPASDHRSMILAGIETVSLSLLNAVEIDQIVGMISGQSKDIPPVLATIHTPKDTLEMVKPAEMEKAFPVLERLLRILDEK